MNTITTIILTSTLTTILSSGFAAPQLRGNDISGKITDAQNKALDYVTASLIRASDSTLIRTVMSDEKGGFSFKDVPRGEYKILLTQVGLEKYYSRTIAVTEAKADVDLGTIVMTAATKTLQEVRITAQKPFIERQGDKLVVNVASSTVSAGSSALEVLQKAPGVSLDKDDNISLKGKQGVLIMIDGKPTYLSMADLANMLRNMQSNEIESLEIITNPSARYEAEGKSGIINIRLKKNKNFGTNGTLTAGAGYSNYRKNNAGISLNNRSKKFNLFGNYNYGNNEGQQQTNIDRINNYGGVRSLFTQAGQGERYWYNHGVKAGADFFISKNHTLGAMINGYFNKWNDDFGNTTLIGSSTGVTDSTVQSRNVMHSTYRNLSYNLNYKGTLDSNGRELSLDADYSTNYSNDKTDYDNRYLYTAGSRQTTELLKNHTPSHIDIYAIKADYVHPLSKTMKVEAGYKSSWVKTDNDFQFNRFENNVWNNDPSRSNHFVYKENINAAYVNARKEFKKWNLQAGLRAEQTNSKGNLITTGQVATRHYLDFFPARR
ncbi:outer membrane beta-barrel protein [Arcticibacter sp. MXS-1]|uniref:outer membrane beta-barrel protein n=1 Tax=Arcticibacter sp. MXS-1 TaxID=3341726 RepID=UPI0035A83A9A